MTAMTPSRRETLFGLGASVAGAILPVRVSLAAGKPGKPLIVILLHGGPDGQALVPAYGDPDYHGQRGVLALPSPSSPGGILDLTGKIGLHPELESLLPFWDRGQLHIAPAMAGPYRGRDLAEADSILQSGGASETASPKDGWLNRAIAAAGGAASGSTLALSYGDRSTGALPLVLQGAAPASKGDAFRFPPFGPGFQAKVKALYALDGVLGDALDAALSAETAMTEALGPAHTALGERGYSGMSFSVIAEDLGKALVGTSGPTAAVVEIGGWDTHRAQGAATGPLARRIRALGDGLAALIDGLGAQWKDSAVLVLGASGRSVTPNRAGGTDHGIAGAGFVLSGGLDLPRVMGSVPKLGRDALLDGDALAPSVDSRAILKSVLARHWGLNRSALNKRVFPESGSVAPL